MAYVQQAALSDGALMTADVWNRCIVDNTQFLYSPPGAVAYYPIATNFDTGVKQQEVQVPAYGTVFDNANMIDGAGGLVMNTTGVYFCFATLTLAGPSGGSLSVGRTILYMRSSAGLVFASNNYQTMATVAQIKLGVSGYFKFNAGEGMSAFIFQTHDDNAVILRGTLETHNMYARVGAHWVSAGEATP